MGAWPCAVPGTALPGTAVRALGGARDQDPCRPNTRLSHRGKSEVLKGMVSKHGSLFSFSSRMKRTTTAC